MLFLLVVSDTFKQTCMQSDASLFSVTNKKKRKDAPQQEGWTSRGHYFDVKKQRLVEQFEQNRASDKPQIFSGKH
jgi:hypothetical protein